MSRFSRRILLHEVAQSDVITALFLDISYESEEVFLFLNAFCIKCNGYADYLRTFAVFREQSSLEAERKSGGQ